MAYLEYNKIETQTKLYFMDWLICGLNEWTPEYAIT